MTLTEAAQSMRTAATKLEAWARATSNLELTEGAMFARVLRAEAARLRADADSICPAETHNAAESRTGAST